VQIVETTDDPRLIDAVAKMDLEVIVAKRGADPYAQTIEWFKVKHAEYSQKKGRAELFHGRATALLCGHRVREAFLAGDAERSGRRSSGGVLAHLHPVLRFGCCSRDRGP
jgi:ATP-dependent DNA ligase